MSPRRSFRSNRNSSQRRKVQWLGGTVSADQEVIASTELTSVFGQSWIRAPAGTLDSSNDEPVEVDWTLIRSIHAASVTVQKIVSDGHVGFQVGMGVIAWDAISDDPLDPLQVPLPLQSPQFDWIWWWSSPQADELVSTGDLYHAQNLAGPSGNVFTRSQRKLSQGTGLLLVAECLTHTPGSVANWAWQYNSRYAYKLP